MRDLVGADVDERARSSSASPRSESIPASIDHAPRGGDTARLPGATSVDLGAKLPTLPGPALLLVVAAVYLALAQFVIWLNDPIQAGAGFWPAAGVSLGLLLLLERRQWPWVLGGVALAEFGGDLLHGYELGAIVLWTAGNVVEPLIGATLIRRFSSEGGSLTPLRAFLGFLAFGVVGGPLIGATIGSLGTTTLGAMPFVVVWPKYLAGDALGVLVVAPLLLTLTQRFTGRSRVEAITLAVASTAVTVLVFRNWHVVWDVTLPYLILPFLMWAGLRFGVRGVAMTAFVIANIANWATATGYGPFAITGGTEQAVTLLQVFLGITVTSAFVLAALASDLTDSRALAERQAAHAVDVERNREFRDAFMGVLSHEIRTPITTILGMSHVLSTSDEALDGKRTREYLTDIETEAARLVRLTEDLLVLSRSEGGRLDVAADPIVIRHVVRATTENEQARHSEHRFKVYVPANLPLVLGEEVYVEQVLRNFLSNAVKYSPPQTDVRVVVSSEDEGVAVRVIDSGPGLPEGSPDRLFDVFYRAPSAIGTSAGAGVGLYVCRELVKAMGGRVWAADSPTPPGAEFGFWLTAAREDFEERS